MTFAARRVTAAAATHQLVHLDVFSVELDAAHAVAHVCLPAHKVGTQIVPNNNIITSRLKNDIFSAQTRALQQTQVSQSATSNPTFSRRRCRIPPPQHALGHCTSCQTPRTNSPCQSVTKKHWVAGKERAPGGGFVPRLEAGDGHVSLPWVPCARGYQLLQYCARQRADAA